MQFARGIQTLQEHLRELVGFLERKVLSVIIVAIDNLIIAASNAEAHKAHNNIVDNIEASIVLEHNSEASCETAMFSYVFAQTFQAICANDEPELE